MKRVLYHPLWAHLPALAMLGAIAAIWARAWPLPPSVPMHFGWSGRPDSWGPGWAAALAGVGFPLLLVIGSIVLDELWARQEKRKRFNWLSLLDEAMMGFLVAVTMPHVAAIRTQSEFHLPWAWALALAGADVLAAIVLEYLRPHRTAPEHIEMHDSQATEELVQRIHSGQRWAYWQAQCPRWVDWVSAGGATLLLASLLLRPPLWIALINAATGILLLTGYGGMRVSVTPGRLVVRLGLLGLPLLRIKPGDLTDVQVQEFSPLADFGGWGIRWNGKVWGYFLRGGRGVKLRTAKGKQYLIGSDHADDLAAVLRAAMPHESAA